MNNEDLKFIIERANEISRLYEKQRIHYLELNLALLTAYSIILTFLLNIFNAKGDYFVLLTMLFYSISTLGNVGYNVIQNSTEKKAEKSEGIHKSLVHFKDYIGKDYKEQNYDFPENDQSFKVEFQNQIRNIHKFQKNYYKLAKVTRIITESGIIILIFCLIISFIMNSVIIL